VTLISPHFIISCVRHVVITDCMESKRLEGEAGRSPPSSVEVKSTGAVSSLSYMPSWHSA
jgi:hypothetical protein